MTENHAHFPSMLAAKGRMAPSFSLRHRLFRALWQLTWLLLARWTPPPFHPWRRLLLRIFGAQIGRGARIYSSAKIWYPPNLAMGDYATIGPQVNCYCQARIEIGAYATVSQYAHLVTGSHELESEHFQLVTSPIRIGGMAWIAANGFVGTGVHVGEGAVLGACGVAFGDLEPWQVYAGNPARRLKARGRPSGPVPLSAGQGHEAAGEVVERRDGG